MQTVVVTGSNGLVGQKLVSLLADRPSVNLVAWSRGANRNPRRQGYQYEDVDLQQADALVARVAALKPDAIVHCAALSQADACERDPAACQAANVGTVENLLLATRDLNTHLVLLSTDFVFDGTEGPYREDAPTRPLSAYGRAKLQAEELVLRAPQPTTIVRTALVYGYAPGLSRSNLVLWVHKSLKDKERIRVAEDQWRTPTLAEDLADALAVIALRTRTGVYHVSGSEYLSVFEFAQQTALALDLEPGLVLPITTAELAEAAPRPLKTGLVILKAQTELGFQPTPLAGGLAAVRQQLKQA